jgi:hypothetical protein
MQVAQHTTQAQEREAAAAAAGQSGATEVVVPSPSPPASSSSSSPPAAAEAAPLVQFQRYCHVYREGELEELFRSQFIVAPAQGDRTAAAAATEAGNEAPELRFVEHYYDRGNWCVVVQKLRETRFDKQEQEEERQQQAASSGDASASTAVAK